MLNKLNNQRFPSRFQFASKLEPMTNLGGPTVLYCTSYSRPLFFPLSFIFGLWNQASHVEGRKKHEFALFYFALVPFAFIGAFFSSCFHSFLLCAGSDKQKSAGVHLCHQSVENVTETIILLHLELLLLPSEIN